MKTKATHYGTCQLCGSLQKLPNGVLALHGYEVDWNQFHGICRGAGYAPFEQSKELAVEEMRRAELFLATHPALPDPNLPRSEYGKRKENPAWVAWYERKEARYACANIVAFQKPRCANWSVKPLKEVAEEDAKAETVKVASRNVRQLASLRNDAKWALGKAIDNHNDIIGYDAFGCLNSATCAKIAGLVAGSRGWTRGEFRQSKFDLDEAMAEVSHMLTAHAEFVAAKAAADEAKAAFEADKKAALQARGAAGGEGEE
jgi:hypothetical protein